MRGESWLRRQTLMLAKRTPEERRRFLALLTPADLIRYDVDFESWIHDGQIEPTGEGWRCWLMMAGRGYGKTRAGAEWITGLATQRGRAVRIALVGATDAEVRKVMIEGESGLIAVARHRGLRLAWEPSLGRLSWPNGSLAEVFSGEAPERLRGPQHHYAWCDELAKWAYPEATWDNLQLGLRSGVRPRALVTTPRPIPLLKRIRTEAWTVETHGRSDDNITLPETFLDVMTATYGGTRFGRQELDGQLIEDIEGTLWTRATIEQARGGAVAPQEALQRIVVGVDPPASAGGTCGIVVCGLGPGAPGEASGHVLADMSAGGLSPEGWARRVAAAAEGWGASRIVVENNQGGDMVASVLRAVDPTLPVRPVRASVGKGLRAEPVALLFEQGRVRLAGRFSELEDELAGMTSGAYQGPGRSPDRADAMVWALTELMLTRKRATPRIRLL